MAGVERWRQCVGLNLLGSDLDQLARFARTLGLGYHVIRAYRLRCPDNDRRLAIVELLNNALTKRFPGKKVGVPPDCEAFCLKIRGKIPRELNMRLRVTDEYVCHQMRSNQDDWTSTIPALQVTWRCRTRKTDSLNSRNFSKSRVIGFTPSMKGET